MKALTESQKKAIKSYEDELAKNASSEDWYVEEQNTQSNETVHPIKGHKGWTAKRDGKRFAVAFDGEFKFYAVRLKAVPGLIKSFKAS